MIIKREESIKSITEMLTRFVIDLSLLNGAGLYDINTTSEHFFIKILDITYNLSLKNLNIEKSNFPAIDLGDFNKKMCFQTQPHRFMSDPSILLAFSLPM